MTRTVTGWIEELSGVGVPAGPIQTLDQLFASPLAESRGLVVTQPHPALGAIRTVASPLRLSATPPVIHRHPPRLSEHTRDILTELGYAAAEIDRLAADRVI